MATSWADLGGGPGACAPPFCGKFVFLLMYKCLLHLQDSVKDINEYFFFMLANMMILNNKQIVWLLAAAVQYIFR